MGGWGFICSIVHITFEPLGQSVALLTEQLNRQRLMKTKFWTPKPFFV